MFKKKKKTTKNAPLGKFIRKIPNVDILWMTRAWRCTVTLTSSTIKLTQRDNTNQSADQSFSQPINQSAIQTYGHLSLHLTDDTNALLHCMTWTSVSVYSSFILSHIRYVSGSMSETLIFNKKNKSLCTKVSCVCVYCQMAVLTKVYFFLSL